MNNIMFRTLLRWAEGIIHLVVPLTAVVVSIYPDVLGVEDNSHILLRLILGLLAGIAVADMLARYITLKDIEDQTKKLSDLSNVSLLKSARDSGVVDLFSRANAERLNSIIDAINNTTGTIALCGVALPSMVEHEGLKNAIVDVSKKHDVKVMLLKPHSFEASRREQIEFPLGTKTTSDIIGTESWIREQMINNRRFRLHLYETPPMLSLIITDQFVFVEPYHFGRPDGVEGCIGGKVPMLKIRNQPEMGKDNTYSFFKEHFEYLWNYTRGSRVNLPIDLVESMSSSFVILKNSSEFDIRTSGWELSGQDSQSPFQFEAGFTWNKGGTIAIAQREKVAPKADRVFHTQRNFMGGNTILRLTNDSGTLLNEWSIIHAEV